MAHGFGGSKRSRRRRRASSRRATGSSCWPTRRAASAGPPGRSPSTRWTTRSRTPERLSTGSPTQPEVQLDGPGDPRVGVTGGSYGGALSLMLAGTDPRVDALVPLITWNDLAQALFPNAQATPDDLAAPTPAAAAGVAGRRVQEALGVHADRLGDDRRRAVRLADRRRPGRQRRQRLRPARRSGTQTSAAPTPDAGTDGRCRRDTDAQRDGGAAAAAFAGELRPDEPRALRRLLAGRADRPDHPRAAGAAGPLQPEGGGRRHHRADAAGAGRAGHPVRARAGRRQRQGDRGERRDGRRDLVQRRPRRRQPGHRDPEPDQRVVPALPGAAPARSRPPPSGTPSTARSATPAGPAAAPWRRPPTPGSAAGDPTAARRHPGRPASRSSWSTRPAPRRRRSPRLPGLSGIASTALSTFLGGLPGQTARFTSAPCAELTVLTGTPRITVDVSQVTGAIGVRRGRRPAPTTAPCSSARWPRSPRAATGRWPAVPSRRSGSPTCPPTAARSQVTIDLPAAALQVEAGSTLEVNLSTTDQAFAGPTTPAAYRIALADSAVAGLDAPARSAPPRSAACGCPRRRSRSAS